MGRASQEQAGKNRAAVVEAASRLFRSRGVEGVGLREVMKAAGLTLGAFAKQFGSKDALAAEACTHAFEGAERTFRAAIQGPLQGRARRLVEDYLSPGSADQACPMATLGCDAARASGDSAMQAAYAQGLDRLARTVAGGSPAPERLVLLAAMVGARLLTDAGRNPDFTERMRAAVAAYAGALD